MTSPAPRLGADVLDELDRRLAPADAELAARYPGDPGTRQPVHTVYVPADQMTPGLTADWGGRALAALADHAPTAAALAGFLARGLDCGALTEAEVTGHTGLDRAAVDQFARRSGRG